MPFFRLIDRYILGELFKPFLAGVLAFMIIMISNTLYIFMELIVKSNIDPGTVGRMLAFNLPAIVVVTLPVAYMFATLLALGRLGRDSEIIALRAAGISLNRVIASVILASIVISAIGWGLQEKVVPWANQQTVEILKNMMKREPLQALKEKNFLKADNRNFYVQSIDRKKNLLKKIYIMDQSKGGHPQIITAETATRKQTKWILNKGVLRKLDYQGFVDHEIRFERMEIEMDLKPELIFNNGVDVRQVASGEAAKLIDEKRKRGEDTKRDEMDYHTKFSLPLATFFTILLAAPIGIRFSKMGNYFGVAISIALVFVWYLAYSTFTSLGAAGTVPPVLAAWVQNLAFGIVGILLLLQMQDIKIFTILFSPLLMVLRPFREAVLGRPLSLDPDDKPTQIESSKKERRAAVLLHLLGLPGFFFLPLIVWLRQRRRSVFLAQHARSLLNFQLSFVLHLLLLGGLTVGLAWIFLVQSYVPIKLPIELNSEYFVYLGLGLGGLLVLVGLVAGISAAIRAGKSQLYRYPLALPFVKAKWIRVPIPAEAAPEADSPDSLDIPDSLAEEKTSEATVDPALATAIDSTPALAPSEAEPEITVPANTETGSTASESPTEVYLEPFSTQAETWPSQPATTPETEPETQAQIATEAPALQRRPKVKAERLSPGLNWRNTWIYRETSGQLRIKQRGGAWARLTLLLLSVVFLLIGIVAYDQTQVLKLSFYCAKTPEPACVFQEQALLRQTRNAIPVGAIRDILVIPKTIQQPEQKEPIPVFDIVLQTTQNQIWITTLSEEPAAHILAGNIRLFAQGFADKAAPIEQVHYVPLAAFGGGLAALLLLLWLVWPLRWRKEFALSGQSLSLRRRGAWQSYPLSELGKLVLEPGAFDRQSLILSWRPPSSEVQEEQTLLLAQALNATQADALLDLLKPWLQSAAVESSAPWPDEDQDEPEDESEGDSPQP
ncbi:MAG: LptF/LptG family permease [Candidatus Sericytochromatia bacterium]|nr:LptF/LptG family permease [Candidatus Sericytochromatia bacterium]